MQKTHDEIVREQNQLTTIYNPLSEPFVHPWDGVPYTLPPKQSLALAGFIARHLAHHLAKYILIHFDKRLVDTVVDGKVKGHALPMSEVDALAESLLNHTPASFVMDGDKFEMEAPVAPVEVDEEFLGRKKVKKGGKKDKQEKEEEPTVETQEEDKQEGEPVVETSGGGDELASEMPSSFKKGR